MQNNKSIVIQAFNLIFLFWGNTVLLKALKIEL